MCDRELEKLVVLGKIDRRQYDAGDKLRLHAERVGVNGRLQSIDLQMSRMTDPARYGSLPQFHLDRYQRAMEVVGTIAWGLLVPVICQDVPPRQMTAAIGRSPGGVGTAVVVKLIGEALDALAQEWGL